MNDFIFRNNQDVTGAFSGLPAAIAAGFAASNIEIACKCCEKGSAADGQRVSRMRLWEIPPAHHCVLIGASFDTRELRQIFRRSGYREWETLEDYELHSSAVNCAQARNEFSNIAHKLLDERYRHAITRFKEIRSPKELLGLWREGVARGDPMPAYWAALTQPACDADSSETLSREMHMLAHNSFAARRAATRQILALEERATGLEDARTRSSKQCEALRREAARLRNETNAARGELTEVRQTLLLLRNELELWERGEKADVLNMRIQAVTAERDRALAEVLEAKNALKVATRQIEWLQRARREAPPTDRPVDPDAEVVCAQSAGEAPACPDLSRRQILCVGGKTRLVPSYRELVQTANGAFSYHDGGIEDHVGRLPAMLTGADAVVCLVGDVSHSAYHLVKRYCKRTGKPCALVKNSGAGALSRCLVAIADAGNGQWIGTVI